MTNNPNEVKTTILAETENNLVWMAEEPDEETTYHLQINNVTIHFFQEEWDEFLAEMENPENYPQAEPAEDDSYQIEFENVVVYLMPEEWREFRELVKMLVGR